MEPRPGGPPSRYLSIADSYLALSGAQISSGALESAADTGPGRSAVGAERRAGRCRAGAAAGWGPGAKPRGTDSGCREDVKVIFRGDGAWLFRGTAGCGPRG